MAKPIKEWVEQDLPKRKGIPADQMSERDFFYDPIRPRYVDENYIFAPVDGIILYEKEVGPDEEIIEIKGKNFTVQNLMENFDFNSRALVIGIFLTQWHVHMLRCPYSGFVKYRRLEKIATSNKPMMNEELDIMRGIINYDDMEYVFENERFLYEVNDNRNQYKFYMVAIADSEVDVIANFYESGKFLTQNQKIAGIRWGSQCDLILPLPMPYNLKLQIPPYYSVEGSIDILANIYDRN